MKKTIYSLLITSLVFLMSCGGGTTEVKIGEKFQVDEWEMSIEELTSTSILVNEAEKAVLVAPKGKTYVKVRLLCNGSDHVMGIYVGENKLKEADYMDVKDFISEDAGVDASYCESIYELEAGQSIDRIEVRGFGRGSASFVLNEVSVKQKEDRKVAPQMLAFIDEFKSAVPLMEVVKKYTSQDPYEVVTESGMDTPASPSLRNLRIHYMSKNGSSYECYADGLGLVTLSVKWTNGEISSLEFAT